MRTVLMVLVASGVVALGGCISVVEYGPDGVGPVGERWYVDGEEMTALVRANKSLRIGMSRDEALGLYPPGLTTLMSSMVVEGRRVEEWRVEAWEGSRRHVRSRFVRWLYFADGSLARFGEERFDYAAHPEVVRGW